MQLDPRDPEMVRTYLDNAHGAWAQMAAGQIRSGELGRAAESSATARTFDTVHRALFGYAATDAEDNPAAEDAAARFARVSGQPMVLIDPGEPEGYGGGWSLPVPPLSPAWKFYGSAVGAGVLTSIALGLWF